MRIFKASRVCQLSSSAYSHTWSVISASSDYTFVPTHFSGSTQNAVELLRDPVVRPLNLIHFFQAVMRGMWQRAPEIPAGFRPHAAHSGSDVKPEHSGGFTGGITTERGMIIENIFLGGLHGKENLSWPT